ncbi:MAG: site-2 protease family protein, partial [Clostridia bacterium]|nr:site-2 protease family protein [Clostridia bacterium]
RFRNPKADMAICAAAGPLSNLLLTCLLLLIYGLVYLPLLELEKTWADILLQTIATTSYLSLALAVFNILPISPLDGSKVLFSFLKPQQYYRLMRYERYGMIILLILMATDILGNPLSAVTGWLYDRLFVIAEWSFDIVLNFI